MKKTLLAKYINIKKQKRALRHARVLNRLKINGLTGFEPFVFAVLTATLSLLSYKPMQLREDMCLTKIISFINLIKYFS